MRFMTKLCGTFAALLLSGACLDFSSTSSELKGGGSAQAGDCTLTQGYWKNHEDAWPVTSLALGNRTYTKDMLLGILRTPVRGNGLISLAHQLIAAKLNIAAGADDAAISAAIAAADDLIGDLMVGPDKLDTSAVSSLVDELDDFNNGKSGPGHCDKNPNPPPPSCDSDDDDEHECPDDEEEPPPPPTCGEDDDDEHECPGEQEPPLPVCGNGVIEDGEECDDGNLVSGDGCSAACICDCPVQH